MVKRITTPFKQIVPRSLLGRFMLIIILPTVLVQVVSTYTFYQRHWNSVSTHMMSALAGEVALVTHISQHQTRDERVRISKLANDYLSLRMSFAKDRKLLDYPDVIPDEKLQQLHDELIKRIFLPLTVNYTNNRQDVMINIQMPHGVLLIEASSKRFENPTTYIFIFWMTGTATLLLIIALMFSRVQIRSISRLAIAAEQFGKGREIQGFKPEGALEVRKAAAAFLKMKERIERQITKRTEMLACVSHDLRTPLTRLKLQLALLGDNSDTQAMQHDIIDMEKMIQGYLDFVRGEGEELSTEIDVCEMLERIILSYGNYAGNLNADIQPGLVMPLRHQAFKRALCNIIDNAMRYGTEVTLSSNYNNNYLTIIIEDNGPGIPEDKREEVFKPFYRLDSSRNLDHGGVGLGLAISRDIIASHGGTVMLGEAALGGLRVAIRIPL